MTNKLIAPLSLALAFAIATPALAVPFCVGGSANGIGAEIIIGGKMKEADRMEFALMALRRQGVDATRVEIWNGCYRAFVRNGSGGEVMEFYDPDTLRQVF